MKDPIIFSFILVFATAWLSCLFFCVRAMKAAEKRGREEVLAHFKKMEAQKWHDAEHCTCLGHAIHTYENPEMEDSAAVS